MAISVEQFIERLTQSGLLSAAEVSKFHDSLPPERRPKDVKQLAQVLVQQGKLTKYQAQAVYQDKAKGLVLGQYVVLDKLGEGGMGVVLKAQHRRMARVVAIKVLSSGAMKQAGAVERFHREVQAAAKLSHPNIVTAYDADEHQGTHYLAMEYVEGEDLATIVKDCGPLEVRQAVECLLQAARGLQYAHEQGIVHRDIKPGNLLLDRKGTVKILDMGLARIAGADAALGGPERLTTTGQVMGTCDYMAPEQSLDTHQADARADIYSLGCTLYRLLTGHPPYQAETFAKLFLMHLEAPIPSLCQGRPEVPEALDAVCQRMLAKKPEDRYQSMAEVVAELEPVLAALSGRSLTAAAGKAESSSAAFGKSLAFLREEPPVATPPKQAKPAAAERTQPSIGPQHDTGSNILGKALGAVAGVRRKPLVLVGIAGGLVLLLGIILVLTFRHGTLVVEIDEKLGKDVQVAVSQGGRKVQVVDARSGWTLSLAAGEYDLTVRGSTDQFQLGPDTVTVKHGGVVKVKVTLRGAKSVRPKPSRVEPEPEAVAVKPGEPLSEMAMVVGPAAVAGVRSWTIETIGHRGTVDALAYSPDGSRLATGGDDGTVRIWDPATGKLLRAILGANQLISSLCWSPDGGMLAVEVWYSGKPMILDVKTGLLLRCDLPDFRPSWQEHASLRWSPDGRRLAYHRNDDVAVLTFPSGGHEVLLRDVGGGHHFSSLAWSPDGTTIATCSEGGGTLIWDAASGAQLKTLTTPPGWDVAWSPDGTMLATAGEKAEVWDTKTWQLRHSFPGKAAPAAWSRDSRTVAFASADNAGIEARDAEAGSVRWAREDSSIKGFVFSPDGGTVALRRYGGDLLLLDATTGQQRNMIPGHANLSSGRSAAFSPDGSQLAAGGWRELNLWDMKTGSLIGGCHPPGAVTAVAWRADGKAIATAGDSNSQVWDAMLRECTSELPGGGSRSWVASGCLGLSPDGTRLADDDEKTIRFWDVSTKQRLFEIPSARAQFSLSPDGKTLAVATEKGAKLYDTATGTAAGSLTGAAKPPDILAWSPDGKALAAGYRDGVHLWDVASAQRTAHSESLGEWANSACWLDEATLALGNAYGACVWDRRNQTTLRTMRGYPVDGWKCCFSPAARLAAFPGQGLIRLRSLDDGRLLYTLLWLRDDFTGVVSPEGHWRGTPDLEKELVYVVQTERGQETISPEEFAKKFGWRNDPSRAAPKVGGQREVTRPKSAGRKPEAATSPLIGPDAKWNLPPGTPPPAVAPFDAKKAKEHQAAWAKHLGVPAEMTNSIGMKLVLIPPGEFTMGSPK
jgi:serine/threonine protein kinase/WD40 repeat protein